jgi:FkbM family methyltransferase
LSGNRDAQCRDDRLMLTGKMVRGLLNRMGWNERMTFAAMDTAAALRRITARGLTVGTVIDIGASNGQWSQSVHRFFPDAHYLLIEAQEVHEPELQRFVARNPRTHYVLKAAGEAPGTIYFDDAEDFAGQAVAENSRPGLIEVPVTTIDAEIARLSLPGPYLIKFDVHGFEQAILRGAPQALAGASLVVMECYNFEIAAESLLFHDMCRWFHERGFRVADMSEPLWRPHDKTLWQMDIFFVPAGRPEFQHMSYR